MQTPARWTPFSTAFTPAAGASTRTRTWCLPRRSLIRQTPPFRCIRWPRHTLWPLTHFHPHTVRTLFLAASKGTHQLSTLGYYTDIGTWVTDFKVSCFNVSFGSALRTKRAECLKIFSPLQTENKMHGIKNMWGCSRGIFQFSGQDICIKNYFGSCNDPALSGRKI